MSDTTIICIVLLIIVVLNIILSFKIRRLEKIFSEIISGEMLRGFSDVMREQFENNKRLSDSITPVSQETLDKLDSQFREIEKQAREFNKRFGEDE